MRCSSLSAWFVISMPFASFACSGAERLNRVEGKVLLKNEPVKGAIVTFHPKGGDPVKAVRPAGFTKDDGSFTLTTGDREGALAGEYTVTFVWPKETSTKAKKPVGTDWNGVPDTPDFFRGSYADVTASTVKVEVKAGDNKLKPFVLK